MSKHRARAISVAATLLAVSFVTAAGAQTDHFKCYKIKDPGAFKSATADFLPSQLQFVGENCSLKGKGAQLCVPASKANVVFDGAGSLQNVDGDALTGAQLCYKVKCPSTASASIQVSDQFGTRSITKGKASKVCGPVIEQ